MRKVIILFIGLVVLGILALSTYLGARMVSGKGQGIGSLLGFGGPVQIGVERSPVLPQIEPDLVGIYVRRQDNSLFLGTGTIKFQTIRESDAEQPRFESGYDGPVVEVLVTHDTQVYYDVSDFDAPKTADGNIQQIVKPGSLDELGKDHLIQVWGEREGDRTVACVLNIWSPPR